MALSVEANATAQTRKNVHRRGLVLLGGVISKAVSTLVGRLSAGGGGLNGLI